MLSVFGATAVNPSFDSANMAYHDGAMTEAIDAYEQLIADNVVDAFVFYNLGSAYYRVGRYGPAIANFERALRLDPGFTDARDNLDACLSQTRRALERPLDPPWEQSLLFWHRGLSPAASSWALAIFNLLFWGILALLQFRTFKFSRVIAVLLGVAVVASGLSVWRKAHPAPLAVASAETVNVHYGMSEADTVHFELYEGDRVLVEARKLGWTRVRTIEGQRGWAKTAQLTFVGPPYKRAPAPTDIEGSGP
jgi:tetratricopeptide (TPR) repeat protein